ncbi:hypothetical protein LX36DRAFT_672870 [Colletotrichum falcatum]|nr:hypothetical protein LX36DRAFT_672870 [Colletotrichum falcatum]
MEEEKHKFMIPTREGRPQPGTVTIDPTSLPSRDVQSPSDSPEMRQIEPFSQHPYPQNAHLRGLPDASPPYPESRVSSEAPVAPAAGRRSPAPAVAPSDTERQQQETLAGWRQRFERGGAGDGKPRKTILGLTVFRFWAAVALGVVIVGVAIAVGLALGLANRYV